MKLSTARDRFVEWARTEKKSASTLANYRSDLNLLVAIATAHAADSVMAFTTDLVKDFFVTVSARKDLQVSTIIRHRATLNEFARWGLRERLWVENPMVVAPRLRRPKRVPRPFHGEERDRLMALDLSLEERAMRAVLYYTGLRATPASTLRLGALSFSPTTFAGGLTVPGSIRAISKGNKESVKPMHPELWGVLRDYYLVRMAQEDPKHFHRAPLFPIRQAGRSGAAAGRPMNRKALERRVRGWGVQANVPDCTPHRFRHTFATDLLSSPDGDIRLIQQLLDHEDIATTALYLKVSDARTARAVMGLRSFTQAAPTTPPTTEHDPSPGVRGKGSVP